MERGPRRARPAPPRDGAVPRRDPPLHQGPAGRAAARRGEPLGRARRRDDGEPVVLRRLAAAVPLARCSPCARWTPTARRRPWSTGRSRDAARARRRRSSSTRTPASTWCGWPAATPGRPHRAGGAPAGGRPADRADGLTTTAGAGHRSSDAERAVDRAAVRYDRAGDQHYDVASAFIKSMRGSDVDAALHYLARMLEAGEDPRFVARRIMIAASEDVGDGRPDRAADGRRRGPGRAADRHAGGADRPRPRPSSTSRWRPSRTPRTWRSTRRSPTSAPGSAGPVPAHLRDAHYAGRAAARPRQGLPVRPRRPARRASSSSTPRTASTAASYYAPTDRGFERELGPRAGPAARTLAARPGAGD